MDNTKYLIIGNGIAGLSAAKEIRNNDESGSIIMVSGEPHLTYYRPKLSEGLAKDYSVDNILVNKGNWYEERNIKLILGKLVEKLNIEKNMIELDDGSRISYEKLLIATGSRPFIPPINGVNKHGVFTLRTFQDLSNIKDYLSDCNKVTVIGGGLLGLEAVWSLKLLGKKINVIEFAPYLLPRQLDKELGQKLKEQLNHEGIDIYLSRTVETIQGDGKVESLKLSGGEVLESDAVLISSGIRPNLDIIKDTPIQYDRGIDVDAYLRTNIENIYAAGDVAEYEGVIYGLWTISNEQGKVAGSNMSGNIQEYNQPKLFSSLRIGDIKIFSVGEIIGNDTVLEYRDVNQHHKLFVNEGIIRGAILYGDLKEMNKLKNCVFTRAKVDDYLIDGLPFK